MANDQKIDIVFIINGQEERVAVNMNAPLLSGVERALSESGNTGRNPSEWEVRDASGSLYDVHRKVGELGLRDGSRVFVSLRVAAGGE